MHELEEQVKDAEARADQSLQEETKRHREAYSKMDRDRNLEIDLLSNRSALQQHMCCCLRAVSASLWYSVISLQLTVSSAPGHWFVFQSLIIQSNWIYLVS